MNRFSKSSALVVFLIMMIVFVNGCSSRFSSPGKGEADTSLSASPVQPVNGTVQSNSAGAVTIDMEWVSENEALVLEVAMNTHSVNLDQYDLKELTVLRDDAGKEYRPISWDSAPGGHHRQGRLTFPLPDSVSQGTARYMEIVIRDVAEIKERVLRWEL